MKSPYCSVLNCENYCEGNTDRCASHNAEARKELRNFKKQKEKRFVPISKMSQKQVDIETELRKIYEEMDKSARFLNGGVLRCNAYPDGDFFLIDHSHTISRARCKQLGKPELIYDSENLEYASRKAHTEWDDYHPNFLKHANFQRRMAFIKQHDPHDYERRMAIWAAHNKPKATV